MSDSIRLLDGGSETGKPHDWPGGAGVFAVAGTFSGATVRLQMLGPDGVTWLDIRGVEFTASGQDDFVLPAGPIRAELFGGEPSGLVAVAIPIVAGG